MWNLFSTLLNIFILTENNTKFNMALKQTGILGWDKQLNKLDE